MTEIIKDGINWQIEHDDEFIKQTTTHEDCKDRIKLRAVTLPLDKGTCTVTCVIDDREVNLRALFPGVYNPIMEFCPVDNITRNVYATSKNNMIVKIPSASWLYTYSCQVTDNDYYVAAWIGVQGGRPGQRDPETGGYLTSICYAKSNSYNDYAWGDYYFGCYWDSNDNNYYPGLVKINNDLYGGVIDVALLKKYDKVKLSVKNNVGGTITKIDSNHEKFENGEYYYKDNKEIIITATPDTGYVFSRFEDENGNVLSAESEYRFKTQRVIQNYAYNVDTVTKEHPLTSNEVIFKVNALTVGDNEGDYNPEGTEYNIIAVFELDYYTLNYSATPSNTGVVEFTYNGHNIGDTVLLRAIPNTGYVFSYFYINGTRIDENEYTYTIAGTNNIQACFAMDVDPSHEGGTFGISYIINPVNSGTVTMTEINN